MKQQYEVLMTASAAVSAKLYIEAESSDAAREIALQKAKEGDVHWNYDGSDEDSASVVVIYNEEGAEVHTL